MVVSVIVPVYKVEEYLTICIDSILKQTFADFELILVDDGSPDNCGEICDGYAQKDSRVKVVHQKNRGLSAARNKGMTIAQGEYFTFIDSDDFVFPHYLEKLVQLCKINDADMSVCGMVRCLSKDSLINMVENFSENRNEVLGSEKMEVFFTTKKINTYAWAKLYKRSLFKSIEYPVGKYNEDIFVTYKIVHIANKIACSDYLGYVYRFNEKSIVNEVFSLKKLHPLEACVERANFIEQNYPSLKKYAYREIVYYCNYIIFSMAKSGTISQEIFINLQKLYRRYLLFYLFDKTALSGKVFALISFLNVKITYSLTKIFFSGTNNA